MQIIKLELKPNHFHDFLLRCLKSFRSPLSSMQHQMAGAAFLLCCADAKLASAGGYLMKDVRRDGEMWVSMLLLGAAEHPVS